MKKKKLVVVLTIIISVLLLLSSILSFLLYSILVWMTFALKVLMLICICYYTFSLIILLTLIILKYKNPLIKIMNFVIIIYLTLIAIMIMEIVVNKVNSNKYTDYYKNCPFNLGTFKLNKCENRRCLSIGNNDYICSYNASNGIYSFNYCTFSKFEPESGQRLDTTEVEKKIICEKATYKKDHINVDLFFSECNNNNYTDFYYCNRQDNFKSYSNIDKDICDANNICDEKHTPYVITEAVVIIACCLIILIFIVLIYKIHRMERKKESIDNNILIANINTISARRLNRRRNSRNNESNCSTEGNRNQEEIKDFKIENAENILVENKEVFVLTSNIKDIPSVEKKNANENGVNGDDKKNDNIDQ